MAGAIRGRPVEFLTAHPMATAVLYVMTGVLPLYLTSTQIISLNEDLGFSAARLGLATSTYFGVGALVSPYAGRLVQRRSATFGLHAGSLFAAAACLVSAAAIRKVMRQPTATPITGSSTPASMLASGMAPCLAPNDTP